MVGATGVVLAVFFQAWGLPIFLWLSVCLGWVLEQKNRHAYIRDITINTDVTNYTRGLIRLYMCLCVLMFLAHFFKDSFSYILSQWDSVSYFKLSLSEDREVDFFTREGAAFGLNIAALIIPIYVAANYRDLINTFPMRGRFIPMITCLFMMPVITLFSVFIISTGYAAYGRPFIHGICFTVYFFQAALLIPIANLD